MLLVEGAVAQSAARTIIGSACTPAKIQDVNTYDSEGTLLIFKFSKTLQVWSSLSILRIRSKITKSFRLKNGFQLRLVFLAYEYCLFLTKSSFRLENQAAILKKYVYFLKLRIFHSLVIQAAFRHWFRRTVEMLDGA